MHGKLAGGARCEEEWLRCSLVLLSQVKKVNMSQKKSKVWNHFQVMRGTDPKKVQCLLCIYTFVVISVK